MESRILTEVAQAWEGTINRKVGIFNDRFRHEDPFYIKEEFAPSDKDALLKQQQLAQNTISPHLRVLQFFSSHFNSIRLGSLNTQRTFIRMISKTLRGFTKTFNHPLTREIHFHVVLMGLHILRFNTCLSRKASWRLKDWILSAGLHWFRSPLAWSFGGNRLQIRAEVSVLTDILSKLGETERIGQGTGNTRQSLQPKLDLLKLLVESERTRLLVWLFPLEQAPGYQPTKDSALHPLLRAAWSTDPGIAIQLAARFPSTSLRQAVRVFLLQSPAKAIGEADALEILLGPSLPTDLSFQLKYLLYWAPSIRCRPSPIFFLPTETIHSSYSTACEH